MPCRVEDREVHQDDDPDSERDRSHDLAGRLGGQLPEALFTSFPFSQATRDVLDENDGTVHDQTKVDRAQAHQVRGDAGGHHPAEGKEHRERDGRRDDQPRSQVAEKDEEDGDDEESSLEEVRLHGPNDASHQRSAVVVGARSGHPWEDWPRVSRFRIRDPRCDR